MDDAERAAYGMQTELTIAKARAVNIACQFVPDYDSEGNAYCADCGEIIPEARMKAIPGCGLCIICTEIRENPEQ